MRNEKAAGGGGGGWLVEDSSRWRGRVEASWPPALGPHNGGYAAGSLHTGHVAGGRRTQQAGEQRESGSFGLTSGDSLSWCRRRNESSRNAIEPSRSCAMLLLNGED